MTRARFAVLLVGFFAVWLLITVANIWHAGAETTDTGKYGVQP